MGRFAKSMPPALSVDAARKMTKAGSNFIFSRDEFNFIRTFFITFSRTLNRHQIYVLGSEAIRLTMVKPK